MNDQRPPDRPKRDRPPGQSGPSRGPGGGGHHGRGNDSRNRGGHHRGPRRDGGGGQRHGGHSHDPRRQRDDRGGHDRGGSDRGGPATREPGLQEVWPNYLQNGYFDSAGAIRLELVSQRTVSPFVKALVRDANPRLSNLQLRKFFHACRSIESGLRGGRLPWSDAVPLIRRVTAAAADSLGGRRIPKLFHDFMSTNLERASSERDFTMGFMPHFEAVTGFAAPFLVERSER